MMGDYCPDRRVPEHRWRSGGSLQGICDGLQAAADRRESFDEVVPGHGAITDKARHSTAHRAR